MFLDLFQTEGGLSDLGITSKVHLSKIKTKLGTLDTSTLPEAPSLPQVRALRCVHQTASGISAAQSLLCPGTCARQLNCCRDGRPSLGRGKRSSSATIQTLDGCNRRTSRDARPNQGCDGVGRAVFVRRRAANRLGHRLGGIRVHRGTVPEVRAFPCRLAQLLSGGDWSVGTAVVCVSLVACDPQLTADNQTTAHCSLRETSWRCTTSSSTRRRRLRCTRWNASSTPRSTACCGTETAKN
jgi:hypothetical protein